MDQKRAPRGGGKKRQHGLAHSSHAAAHAVFGLAKSGNTAVGQFLAFDGTNQPGNTFVNLKRRDGLQMRSRGIALDVCRVSPVLHSRYNSGTFEGERKSGDSSLSGTR
jgi:hypothetical protein